MKYASIEAEERGQDQLAEKIANKVIEKLDARYKRKVVMTDEELRLYNGE